MTELAPQKPTKLDASEIIAHLTESPEFRRNHSEGYPFQRLIARSALEAAGMDHSSELPGIHHDAAMEDKFELDPDYTDAETALNAVIGLMPGFVYGMEGIRHDKTVGRLTRAEYVSMKRRCAQFNHAVKALIENDKSLNAANVVSTVTTLYGVLNRDRWGSDRNGYEQEATQFKRQFEGTVRGMQQEVLAKQIIQEINRACPLRDPATGEKLPRVSVDANVSAQDDLKGVDMYVTLEGVTFPIDIKASERTAQNVREKSSHPQSIITTGISCPELNGAFRVSPHRAFKAAPAMLEKLYAARQEFIDKQAAEQARSTKEFSLAA